MEVTTRTIQGRLLLRPSDEVNDIVLGILGRAQELYAIDIHAFVVLSNHMHVLLTCADAARLACFMAYVNGNIAREVGRLHEWRERFWGRRYRAIVVADETAQVSRLRYILANGCKEGLVDKPGDWPGLNCVQALTRGAPLVGTWHDRTALHIARQRGESVRPGQFTSRHAVRLAPLPCWRSLDETAHRAACADLIAHIEAETRAARQDAVRVSAGQDRILGQDPHTLPWRVDTSPAPLVHASTKRARLLFQSAYRAFVDAYHAAATRLRSGDRLVEFPTAAFPPALPFARFEPGGTATAV